MDLNTLFETTIGTYNPIMINEFVAIDFPYVLKAIFILILLYTIGQAILIVIRGLFRKW